MADHRHVAPVCSDSVIQTHLRISGEFRGTSYYIIICVLDYKEILLLLALPLLVLVWGSITLMQIIH